MSEPAASDIELPFLRLHPLGIALKSLGFLKSQLWALPALYFFLGQSLLAAALAYVAIIAVTVGTASLHWYRLGYRLEANEIRIRSGILGRYHRSIPFKRIQDVGLEQGAVARVFGLSTLKLETGSVEDELGFLSLSDAETLRVQLREKTSGATPTATEKLEAVSDSLPPLFAMSNRRLLVEGLFNFSFIFFAAVAAGFQVIDSVLPKGSLDLSKWILKIFAQDWINRLTQSNPIYGFVMALVGLGIIGMLGGIVLTVLREYGFRLELVEGARNSFRRRRGLLTLTDLAMPIHRIQALILRTGLIRQRLGFYQLEFQLLASDGPDGGNHSAAPCARLEEIAPILAETGIENADPDLEFKRVHPAEWWRRVLLYSLVLGSIGIGGGLFLHPNFYILPLLITPIGLITILEWRAHQYALTGTQLFVRSGWWKRTLTILPIRKLHSVDVRQSPTDLPLGLATISVGMAGGQSKGPLSIGDLPMADALSLRQQLLQNDGASSA